MSVSLPPPHALLFDMDGTLVDSEPLWHVAEQELVACYGHVLEPEVRHKLEGVATPAAMQVLRAHYRLEPDIATLAADLERRVLALLPQAESAPGAAELLAWTARSGLPFALVSNSTHAVIDAALAGKAWAELFAPERRHSAEDVARGKPAPDVYLRAAGALGVAPERCLVIEDTVTGVRAALAAGMTCFAVPAAHADRAAFLALTPHVLDGLGPVLAALEELMSG